VRAFRESLAAWTMTSIPATARESPAPVARSPTMC